MIRPRRCGCGRLTWRSLHVWDEELTSTVDTRPMCARCQVELELYMLSQGERPYPGCVWRGCRAAGTVTVQIVEDGTDVVTGELPLCRAHAEQLRREDAEQ